jgi:predicted transcriptional regulator
MASSDEEILIDKLSTKICQLTRVVYLLNNKYLDAQSNIESIRTTYDKELTSIVRQANDYTKTLQKKIDELEDEEDLEEQFNEFK